ncbi:sensor histidine kinase [Kitasatospora sp. NPDC059327]|uniref:sensor histidine kinase n=1 Tax=Kitasatospora sp. NPDC059327 TaxID=3346803 RepID=UPI0036C95638
MDSPHSHPSPRPWLDTWIPGAIWSVVTGVGVAMGRHVGGTVSDALLGGTIGLAVAAALVTAYRRIRRHLREWARLVAELTAAQAALVEREREAGRLAEREHLAREIHDTVGQSLASVILLLRAALPPARSQDSEERIAQLRTALDTATGALAETRRMVRGLDPAAFSEGGLTEALAAQVADSTALGLCTTLTVEGTPRRIALAGEVALLRAAQEALSNARKHATARGATVTLTFQDDEVSVDIVDDGRGFDPATVGERPDGSGYGLTAMQARILESGGELTVESEAGSGTAIRATVPDARAAEPSTAQPTAVHRATPHPAGIAAGAPAPTLAIDGPHAAPASDHLMGISG